MFFVCGDHRWLLSGTYDVFILYHTMVQLRGNKKELFSMCFIKHLESRPVPNVLYFVLVKNLYATVFQDPSLFNRLMLSVLIALHF